MVNNSFGVNIIQCGTCGLVQTEYVSTAAVEKYYDTYYRAGYDESIREAFRKESADQARSQLTYIDTILPSTHFEKALEIGAGAGEMANALTQKKTKVFVTELDPRYRVLLKANETITVIDNYSLTTPEFTNFFDIAVLSHVLEHVTDPIQSLDMLSSTLKQDGYLFIELPNEVQMLKEKGFQGKGHLYYFTLDTFKKMISVQGSFEILEIRTSNRSIDDYMASNFTLPNDFKIQEKTNGTSIRTLLVNRNPKKIGSDQGHRLSHPQMTLDDYSQRVLELHHHILKRNDVIKELTQKYKSSMSEVSELFKRFNKNTTLP
jgi:2-polyprenyl-3-methyl-5-hydroxy-6-metoxy-1,4-benzoquinol methylase